jgi:hypothetical protein
MTTQANVKTGRPAATREEMENLKRNWALDPIWDIEDTDGFEEFREELLQYRLNCEAQWEARRIERLQAKADEIGCPGNLTLAAYVTNLEAQIARLAEVVQP